MLQAPGIEKGAARQHREAGGEPVNPAGDHAGAEGIVGSDKGVHRHSYSPCDQDRSGIFSFWRQSAASYRPIFRFQDEPTIGYRGALFFGMNQQGIYIQLFYFGVVNN